MDAKLRSHFDSTEGAPDTRLPVTCHINLADKLTVSRELRTTRGQGETAGYPAEFGLLATERRAGQSATSRLLFTGRYPFFCGH
jgi:hypothetical protein